MSSDAATAPPTESGAGTSSTAPRHPTIGVPVPTLKTARLTLRPFTLEDVNSLAEWLADATYTTGVFYGPNSHEETHALFDMLVNAAKAHDAAPDTTPAPAFVLGAWDDAAEGGPVLVGQTAIVFNDGSGGDYNLDVAEIGYQINPEFFRKGYGLEVASAARDYAFKTLGLRRLHASVMGNNKASNRILEKLGFTLEGTRREHFVKRDGSTHDECVWGMLARELPADAGDDVDAGAA